MGSWRLQVPRGHALGGVLLALIACSGRVTRSTSDEPEITRPGRVEGGTKPTDDTRPDAGGAHNGGRSPTGINGGKNALEPDFVEGGAGSGVADAGGAGSAGASGAEAEGGSGGAPSSSEGCPSPIAEAWSAPLGSSPRGWALVFGDPRVDTASHRLVISHDDVAERSTRLTGGYFVQMRVTLEGGTVLVPYPYSNEGPFPSLRRSEDGSSVELGMTQYGTEQTWSSAGWPDEGAMLTGTSEAQLTYYVKASSRAVAAKASHNGVVLRSRWVSGFTWAETSLAALRFIGMNNSKVYEGGDAVYVGPLSGCEGLTDAQVDDLYAE